MSSKYFAVTVTIEYEAESEKQAKTAAEALVAHVWKTGADANIDCPWSITVGDAVLVEEVD